MGRRRQTKTDGHGQLTPDAPQAASGTRARPSVRSAAGMLELQRAAGNRAAYRLVSGAVLQAKLQVGPDGDRFEREADQVADDVMRSFTATVELGDDEHRVSRKVSADDGVVGLEGGPLGDGAAAAIQRERGQGAPLPDPLRQSMEGSFGADFGAVRVHAGPSADELSRSVQARAFTVGGDIFFARGQYQPGSASGQRLLAHELTHTVQQGAAPGIARAPDDCCDSLDD